MSLPPKTDEEIIDTIMGEMYSENEYQTLDFYFFTVEVGDKYDIHYRDCERLWRKMIDEKLIEQTNERINFYMLADKGMEIMRKFGSYSSYLSFLEQPVRSKEKIERNDRRLKNVGIISTLAVSLLTLILTQCPIRKDTPQQKSMGDTLSIAKQRDSLLQVLQNNQTRQENKSKGDTATSK